MESGPPAAGSQEAEFMVPSNPNGGQTSSEGTDHTLSLQIGGSGRKWIQIRL